MITGKILLKDCELRINTNGIQFQPFTIAEDLTIKDDAVDAMNYYITNDLKTTRIVIDDLRKSYLYVKGIWNKEEEEKDMKLESILKIYRQEEEQKYAEERAKKIDKLEKNDKVRTAFVKILNEAEQKLKELYKSNRNCFGFDEDCDSYIDTDLALTDYMYSQRQDIWNDYYEKCKKLDDRVMKIQAKIDLVKETSNDYNEIKNILIKNGILENENCDKKSCKRGRKPKQKVEENK